MSDCRSEAVVRLVYRVGERGIEPAVEIGRVGVPDRVS
jgi:hypothetical protein